MMKLEAARVKFPVGTMVKITNVGRLYSSFDYWAARYLGGYEDYLDWHQPDIEAENGDIGTVLCVNEHGAFGYEMLAAVRVKGKKIFIIDIEGIEPLEDKIPFSEEPLAPGDVPFDVHNEDEFQDMYRKKPEFKLDGKTLIVEACGRRESLNLTEEIDEMLASCRRRSMLIEEGDKVRILDPEETCPNYVEFVKKYLCFEQAMVWQYDRIPEKGSIGRVIIKKPSLDGLFPVCVVQLTSVLEGDHIYLISPNGLEKVEP